MRRDLATLALVSALTLALAGCRADAPADTAVVDAAAVVAGANAAVSGTADEVPTATAAAVASDAPEAHEGLVAQQPWSRPLAPGATIAAGYLQLMNHTTQPETLVAARAEGVGRVEIHDMAEVDGVMQMRPVEGGITLAVDGLAQLQPGGKHLMFFDVGRSWEEGGVVPVTLAFASGREITVDFAITATGAEADAGHGHHHGH